MLSNDTKVVQKHTRFPEIWGLLYRGPVAISSIRISLHGPWQRACLERGCIAMRQYCSNEQLFAKPAAVMSFAEEIARFLNETKDSDGDPLLLEAIEAYLYDTNEGKQN